MSGPHARQVAITLVGSLPRPRVAALRSIVDPDTQDVIDAGLILFFPGPNSFSGEDLIEFQVHGSIAVIRALIAVLAKQSGCRLASAGEFSRRAFLNGKLDLLDIEALGDLLNAETEVQRKLAISGSSSLRLATDNWRDQLVMLRAILEAHIDFSDEDDVGQFIDLETEQSILKLQQEVQSVINRLKHGKQLRDGYRIAILGAPNSGKSSLFNALADRDLVITSPIPGTTRDSVETYIDLDGLSVVLVDTAGMRDTMDGIEAEGIRRARQAADMADLVLWLSPIDSPTECPDCTYIIVHSKSDLVHVYQDDTIYVSTKLQDGLNQLVEYIQKRALSNDLNGSFNLIISHERQADALRQAVVALGRARADFGLTLDLRAEELRTACLALDALLGKISPEAILGAIFSRFCIGK